MSEHSLSVLAQLAGVRRGPPAGLFVDGWPGRGRRALQLAHAASQWWLGPRPALVVCGPGVPSAKGAVDVGATLTWRNWRRGAYVIPGADLTRLTQALALDATPPPGLYLADAGVLVVLGQRRGRPVVVHVCDDTERLQRYAQRAADARSALRACGSEALVPQVLEAGPVGGLHMLVQARLAGRVLRAPALLAGELEAHVGAALQPLADLARAAQPAPAGADDALMASTLPSLRAHPGVAEMVSAPLGALIRWPGRWRLPAVLVHGDYWLSNLLFEDEGRLCGILDWERARPDALAGFDALHLVMFSFAHWRGCAELQVLCMLWDDLCEPVLERMLASACRCCGLTLDDLRHVAIAIWLLHLARHVDEMGRWSPTRRREWLDDPAHSVARWLARRVS